MIDIVRVTPFRKVIPQQKFIAAVMHKLALFFSAYLQSCAMYALRSGTRE